MIWSLCKLPYLISGPPLIFEGNIKTTEHGKRSRGRPRKTWMLVQEDASPLTNDSTVTKDQLISRVQDRDQWRRFDRRARVETF